MSGHHYIDDLTFVISVYRPFYLEYVQSACTLQCIAVNLRIQPLFFSDDLTFVTSVYRPFYLEYVQSACTLQCIAVNRRIQPLFFLTIWPLLPVYAQLACKLLLLSCCCYRAVGHRRVARLCHCQLTAARDAISPSAVCLGYTRSADTCICEGFYRHCRNTAGQLRNSVSACTWTDWT